MSSLTLEREQNFSIFVALVMFSCYNCPIRANNSRRTLQTTIIKISTTMTQTIVVTGAAGFIGSHLCESLLSRGYRVVAVDNLSMGTLDNISNCREYTDFSFHKADVTDSATFLELAKNAGQIIHLAAFKIPRYGKAIDTLRINVYGMLNVLDAAATSNARVVLASTSDVYGKNLEVPFGEEHDSVIGPSNVPRWSYAVSKLFDEHLAFAYCEKYGFPIAVARLFGSYGPRHHLSWWGGPQSVFISAVLRDQEVEIHGDGLQTRSFCYVSDTVDGLIRIIENECASGEIVNIGSTHEISILDLARLIKRLSGTPGELKLRMVPYQTFGRYEDVRRRVPDIEKAKRLLNFEATVSLEEGLQKTLAWQRQKILSR